MDFGAAFWIFVFVIILLSMFAGGSSKSSTRSNGPSPDAPRRVVIETLDSKGQVIKRETATIAPDRLREPPEGEHPKRTTAGRQCPRSSA